VRRRTAGGTPASSQGLRGRGPKATRDSGSGLPAPGRVPLASGSPWPPGPVGLPGPPGLRVPLASGSSQHPGSPWPPGPPGLRVQSASRVPRPPGPVSVHGPASLRVPTASGSSQPPGYPRPPGPVSVPTLPLPLTAGSAPASRLRLSPDSLRSRFLLPTRFPQSASSLRPRSAHLPRVGINPARLSSTERAPPTPRLHPTCPAHPFGSARLAPPTTSAPPDWPRPPLGSARLAPPTPWAPPDWPRPSLWLSTAGSCRLHLSLPGSGHSLLLPLSLRLLLLLLRPRLHLSPALPEENAAILFPQSSPSLRLCQPSPTALWASLGSAHPFGSTWPLSAPPEWNSKTLEKPQNTSIPKAKFDKAGAGLEPKPPEPSSLDTASM
jgi:hypothetical protein